jgi:hypothetical protein
VAALVPRARFAVIGHAGHFPHLVEEFLPPAAGFYRGQVGKKPLKELAFSLTYSASPRAQEIFTELFGWGDAREDLRAVRDRALSCPVSEVLLERRSHVSGQQGEDANESPEARKREFEADAGLIRSGSHLGWLAWAAQVYFCLFTDLDEDATPRERLTALLGESNAEIAIEGFIALLDHPDVPSLDAVVETAAEHKAFNWWYALIAGLDEQWRRNPDLTGLTDEFLRAALALSQACPTFVKTATSSERRPHEWKEAALEQRPDLARDAYIALARAGLRKGEAHVEGLRELLNDEPFAPFRMDITMLLLRKFPNAARFRLDELLRSGLSMVGAHPDLLQSVAGRSNHRRRLAAPAELRRPWRRGTRKTPATTRRRRGRWRRSAGPRPAKAQVSGIGPRGRVPA